jgi:RAD51-like protein 2
MQRAITSLPLSSSWLAKLASCGFETVEDLRNIGVVELSRELGVSNSEALVEIVKVVKRSCELLSAQPAPSSPLSHPHQSHPSGGSCPQLPGVSALELLQQEGVEGSIVTFSAGIDEMLGGGVALGKVTEFCGAPGLGKTQIW